MALIVRQLTNSGSPLYTPSGSLITATAVTFTLTDLVGNPTAAFDVVTGERVTGIVSATTDNAGVFTVNLWPNDRGDKPTKYICRCSGTPDISSQVPSGDTALSWLLFKTNGQILTPAETTQLNAHIADAAAHMTSTQNTLIDAFSAYLSSTEFSYLDGITSSVQGQINAITAASVFSVNSRVGNVTLTSSDVGLGNLNNTSDLNKPVSTATQSALDLKAPLSNPTFTGTVGGITSTMIGLGNADNTSDANKPISTATQTALNLKAPLASPSFTGDSLFTLLATENIVIDARTNPRTAVNTGVLRINHTAGKSGTRPLSIDVDCATFADTHAIAIDYTATGLGAGAENHGIDFSVDTDDSNGGEIAALSVSKTGVGTISVTALEAYPGVHVVEQGVGSTSAADSNFVYSGAAYTDRTAEFTSSGSNIQIFTANTDYIYIGHSVKFDVIDVALTIAASGLGIVPTFEYSDGASSWAVFSPGDTTNGFRQNGTITIPALTGWVTRTVNGVTSKYWVRIRRTNAAAITSPTESTIKIIIATNYAWDNTGKVSVSKLNLKNLPSYATRAAAISAGLVAGDVFQDTNYSLWIV